MEVKVGQLIDGMMPERDAIHVAMIPAMAGENLNPGDRVAVDKNMVATRSNEWHGIVDPFLEELVWEESWFWLWMKPGTVTGIRHHWDHPAFRDSTEDIKWIERFCVYHESTYEEVMDGARKYCSREDDIVACFSTHLDYEAVPEFWERFTRVTGLTPPLIGGFICGC